MPTRITNAIHSLMSALADTGFPTNPVVYDAIKIIKDHVQRLCSNCNGRGKVRIWYAQDELGQPEECKKCKGTGRKPEVLDCPGCGIPVCRTCYYVDGCEHCGVAGI